MPLKVNRPASPPRASSSGPAAPPKPAGAPSAHLGPDRYAAAGKGPTLPQPPASTSPRTGYRDPSFDATLDAVTGSRARAGSTAELLLDGVHSFAARDALIDGAKESICLQTFIFDSDETGWALAHKLADKARAGVKVRVLYDAVGSERADGALFDFMRSAGVEVRAYGEPWKLWSLNDRAHEKHLVVDGRTAVEGGMNIANEYALGGTDRPVLSRGDGPEKPWRDVDVKLEGPAVGDATRAFIRAWDALGAPLSDSDRARLLPPLAARPSATRVRFVESDPEGQSAGRTEQLYVEAIRHARTSITLENAYFVPSPSIHAALLDAARRGVQVRVLTNSRTSTDVGVVADAARYHYDDLVKAGVQVYEQAGRTLHSKTASFDGEFSIVGSVNLNGRSANLDKEDAVAVDDPAMAQQLEARFAQGLTEAHRVTSEELDHEGLLTNLRQWAASAFSWTL